jgi:hypothetical protein
MGAGKIFVKHRRRDLTYERTHAHNRRTRYRSDNKNEAGGLKGQFPGPMARSKQ